MHTYFPLWVVCNVTLNLPPTSQHVHLTFFAYLPDKWRQIDEYEGISLVLIKYVAKRPTLVSFAYTQAHHADQRCILGGNRSSPGTGSMSNLLNLLSNQWSRQGYYRTEKRLWPYSGRHVAYRNIYSSWGSWLSLITLPFSSCSVQTNPWWNLGLLRSRDGVSQWQHANTTLNIYRAKRFLKSTFCRCTHDCRGGGTMQLRFTGCTVVKGRPAQIHKTLLLPSTVSH